MKHLSFRVPKKKIDRRIGGLPTVKCLCGTVILLVPNVKMMSQVVEAHVAKHLKKVKDPKEAQAEAERIRDDLITKILDKASKS